MPHALTRAAPQAALKRTSHGAGPKLRLSLPANANVNANANANVNANADANAVETRRLSATALRSTLAG